MNRHNLPFARHAANEYGGWVKIVKWFRLSRKPMEQHVHIYLQNDKNEFSQILAHVCQPHDLRFSCAAFHFLGSLLYIKCMLPTIVSSKILLLC